MSQIVYAEILQTGVARAFPTNQRQLIIKNLDGGIVADWGISQAWFDNGLARKDAMLMYGYNFIGEGRNDPTEPAFGWQFEDYDVAADLVTPLVAWHFTYLHTDDSLVRPISGFIIRASGISDVSFQNRNAAFYAQNGTSLILHAAANAAGGVPASVGVGTIANANAHLHVRGNSNLLLLDHAAGAADNKFWDWSPAAGSISFRAVNDAYGAAGTVFRVDRTGTTVDALHMFCKMGVGTGGDVFLSRPAASAAAFASAVGAYNVTLRLLAIDVQGADGAGAGGGTLLNAPHAGNPDAWVPMYHLGVLGWVPWWHA